MGWLTDMFVIFLLGIINIISAVTLGVYWLKNEAFPWEKVKKGHDQKEGD